MNRAPDVFFDIRLMQMVHLNNVEAMKFVRRSKSPVEVANIKQIVAKNEDPAKKSLTISSTGNQSTFSI